MKFFSKYRQLIIGFVIGALITLPTGLFAASSLQTVKMYIRPDFKLSLNGQQLQLNNPVIVNEAGTSYLPLREMGEKLELNVDWDDKTGTVLLDYEKPQVNSNKTNDETTTNNNSEKESDTVSTNTEQIEIIKDYLKIEDNDDPVLKVNGNIYLSLDAGIKKYELSGYDMTDHSIKFKNSDIEVELIPENGITSPVKLPDPGDGFFYAMKRYIKESIFIAVKAENN